MQAPAHTHTHTISLRGTQWALFILLNTKGPHNIWRGRPHVEISSVSLLFLVDNDDFVIYLFFLFMPSSLCYTTRHTMSIAHCPSLSLSLSVSFACCLNVHGLRMRKKRITISSSIPMHLSFRTEGIVHARLVDAKWHSSASAYSIFLHYPVMHISSSWTQRRRSKGKRWLSVCASIYLLHSLSSLSLSVNALTILSLVLPL